MNIFVHTRFRLRPKQNIKEFNDEPRKRVMDEDKIILDKQSFEALAVDTRIKILKSLRERRKTLSEISEEQKMSPSGIKEHLETLENAGLVVKKDDGHKWKYYELTKKGAQIVAPKELRVWIMLSISMIALAGAMLAIMYSGSPFGFGSPAASPQVASNSAIPSEQMVSAATPPAQPDEGEGAKMPTSTATVPPSPTNAATGAANVDVNQKSLETANITNTLRTQITAVPASKDITIPIVVAGISAVTLVGSLAILAMNRMKK